MVRTKGGSYVIMASTNPWIIHVKKVKKDNPKMSFKDVLKKASSSFKKK